MLVFRTFSELLEFLEDCKSQNSTIGFVPTMGALHAGHISLVEESQKHTDITLCSIFINPTQFNNADDLTKYPRTEEEDLKKLKAARADVVFIPSVEEVYPGNYHTQKIELGDIAEVMEGESRPGHFDGVVQVVGRFFEQIQPDHAFFGEKDYQQLAVIRKMVLERGFSVHIHSCPIHRESSGLAMSSRNMRLSAEGKEKAAFIYHKLKWMADNFESIPNDQLIEDVSRFFHASPDFNLDYLIFGNKDTLQVPKSKGEKTQVFIAVFLEGVRLIDNMAMN